MTRGGKKKLKIFAKMAKMNKSWLMDKRGKKLQNI